jgi:hypothetical protein
MFRRTPSFTVASIVCLTLGIGATTAIFSVVYGVLMKPLPFAGPERMVRIYSEFPNFPGGGLHKFWLSGPEYMDLKREAKLWESLDGWVADSSNDVQSDRRTDAGTGRFAGGGPVDRQQ